MTLRQWTGSLLFQLTNILHYIYYSMIYYFSFIEKEFSRNVRRVNMFIVLFCLLSYCYMA